MTYPVPYDPDSEYDLGRIDSAWNGWRLRDGQLYAPLSAAVIGYRPGEVRAIPIRLQEIAAYRRTVRELQEKKQRADWRLHSMRKTALIVVAATLAASTSASAASNDVRQCQEIAQKQLDRIDGMMRSGYREPFGNRLREDRRRWRQVYERCKADPYAYRKP